MKFSAAQLIALLKGCHPDAAVLCWDASESAWANAHAEVQHFGASRLPNMIKIGAPAHFEDARMMMLPHPDLLSNKP